MISGKLLVWLLLATLVTYGTGRWLAAIPVRHSDLHGKALTRKSVVCWHLELFLILGALVTLKYLRVFGVTLAAPIGISYYSLQAISYMTDVYRGTQESCKNPIKVALYLSFFPQIMEGPISRFSETADALYGGNSIQFENLVFGYQRIIWGLFKKMVIADRLAPLVAKVFSNYNNFDGAAILVGVLAYTMQLYMEFSGCMDIIMGSGEIFGVPLPENFRQPFFAKNAGDFWRRWHITLGAWLKDYVSIRSHLPTSEESGEEDQEESWIFGQQIRGTDDCVILCLAVKRHLAWTTYELYLLWHVLFYAHCDRESDRGTMQEAGGAIQA